MKAHLTIVIGASRGIGRAVAIELGRQGHALALVGHSHREQLAEVKNAIETTSKVRVFDYLSDVAEPREVEELFADVVRDAGVPTGLVNCAGYTGDRLALEDAPLAMIERVVAVNMLATIMCCRAAIRLMSTKSGGTGGAIVNMSSQNARFGGDRLAVYSASKAAVEGLTISLAREVAGAGIRINAVSPGPVLTEPLQALSAQKLADMKTQLPMGRFCEPQEVAATVAWLLSDAASYVSGAIIPVHGAR